MRGDTGDYDTPKRKDVWLSIVMISVTQSDDKSGNDGDEGWHKQL